MSKISQTIFHRKSLGKEPARKMAFLSILILCFSTAPAEDSILLGVLEQSQANNVTKPITGWVHIPDYRPLVIISESNFKDPKKGARIHRA